MQPVLGLLVEMQYLECCKGATRVFASSHFAPLRIQMEFEIFVEIGPQHRWLVLAIALPFPRAMPQPVFPLNSVVQRVVF